MTTVRANQKDILNRLATIEGHLKGIRKMVVAPHSTVVGVVGL